jgi:hypothetical protein
MATSPNKVTKPNKATPRKENKVAKTKEVTPKNKVAYTKEVTPKKKVAYTKGPGDRRADVGVTRTRGGGYRGFHGGLTKAPKNKVAYTSARGKRFTSIDGAELRAATNAARLKVAKKRIIPYSKLRQYVHNPRGANVRRWGTRKALVKQFSKRKQAFIKSAEKAKQLANKGVVVRNNYEKHQLKKVKINKKKGIVTATMRREFFTGRMV